MTFDQFLEGLRALEARGVIKVTRWPEHENDQFRMRFVHTNLEGDMEVKPEDAIALAAIMSSTKESMH